MGLFIIAVIMVGAGIGACWLVSRYTGLGMFEPLVAVATFVVFVTVTDYKGMFSEYMAELRVDDNKFLMVLTVITSLCAMTLMFCLAMLLAAFAFYGLCAVISKKCRGKLVRIDKPKGKKGKFTFYEIDGKQYQCAVTGASKKLVIGNEYNVRLNRFQKKVYDKGTMPFCITGIAIALGAAAILLHLYILA